jgi:hypothetical protein
MRLFGPILTVLIVYHLGLGAAGAQTQVTVYKGDLALVSETRELRIGAQQLELVWPAVAAGLDPGSTHLTVTEGDRLAVLEERFLPLPASALEMMGAYLGQPVEVRVAANEWIEGRLEAIRQGTLVLEQAGVQTLIPYGAETLVRLPEAGLDTPPPPALIWQIEAPSGGQRTLTLAYLTAGLAWTVDYFGEVNAAEDQLLLSAKATIRNQSGKEFHEADVTLAAGTVNQVTASPLRAPVARAAKGGGAETMAAPAPQPQAMADLHFYPLAAPLTLKDGAQVQRLLIAPRRIACKRAYRYRSHHHPKQISTAVTFVNDKTSGLDQPLPAGAWRLYRRTEQGLRYIGADQRPASAPNAQLTLELGQAFDLTAERRVLKRRKLSARSEEQQVEITLSSGKQNGSVTIEVEERMARGQWEITQSSLAPTRQDADTLVFEVPVPADAETRLTYTVVRSW